MRTSNIVPVVLTTFFAVLFWWTSQTMSSVAIFIPAIIISLIISFRKSDYLSDNALNLLPWYLALMGMQMLHFTEEYLTGFTEKLPALLGQDPYPMQFWICFNMIAYAIFIIGAIIIQQKRSQFYIIPVFFVLVGSILNPIGHVLFTVYTGAYFPGLITAILLGLIVFLGLKRQSHY